VPLRDPVTDTSRISLGGAPKKLIWVTGEASRVPGSGEIVTVGGAAPAVADRSAGASERGAFASALRSAAVRLQAMDMSNTANRAT
jgi:hypothetical protein